MYTIVMDYPLREWVGLTLSGGGGVSDIFFTVQKGGVLGFCHNPLAGIVEAQ
jgi:hypothetical protein